MRARRKLRLVFQSFWSRLGWKAVEGVHLVGAANLCRRTGQGKAGLFFDLWHAGVGRHLQETLPHLTEGRPRVTVAPTAVRVSVILLAVAGALGHLAYLDALWWHSLGLTATVARNVSSSTIMLLSAHAVVSLVCSVLSIAMVLNERPRQEAARSLALAFGAWSYLMAYSGVTILFRPAAPGMSREIFEAHFLVVEVVGLAGLLRYTSIFPRPLTTEELQPLETLPKALLPFHHVAVMMRGRYAPVAAAVVVPVSLWSWTSMIGGNISDAGLSRAMDVVRFCAAGLVVMNLVRAWRAATEGDRDGLAWLLVSLSCLLGAIAVVIGGNVLVAVTGFTEPNVAWRPILLDLGMIGFLGGLAWSVLDRGGIDASVVINRVCIAASIVTASLFLAAGLEALFTGGIFPGLALRRGVGTAISFAIMLSMYGGIAKRIERVLPL
jgi:hypothetical protein